MEIRKADISELDEIIALNKIVDYSQSDSFMKESVELWRVYVAVIEGEIVSFLLYQEVWGNTILLALLKVHSDFYSQWIGTKMIQFFEDVLRSRWVQTYTSSTMHDNPGAQRFHERNWFKDIWALDMHYGSEIFYRKDL